MKQWFWVFGWALLTQAGSTLLAEGLTSPTASTAAVNGVVVSSEPFVWPVSKIIAGHHVKIVSKFGHRKALDTQLDEMHEGVDFAVPAESYIRAARSGKVLFAGFSSAYVSRRDKTDKNHLVIVV